MKIYRLGIRGGTVIDYHTNYESQGFDFGYEYYADKTKTIFNKDAITEGIKSGIYKFQFANDIHEIPGLSKDNYLDWETKNTDKKQTVKFLWNSGYKLLCNSGYSRCFVTLEELDVIE